MFLTEFYNSIYERSYYYHSLKKSKYNKITDYKKKELKILLFLLFNENVYIVFLTLDKISEIIEDTKIHFFRDFKQMNW